MTSIPTDETRLLVLFGEMRGDLKALLRSQQELAVRLSVNETSTSKRITELDKRIQSLETIKLKVAGFTTALGVAAGVFSDKVLAGLSKLGIMIGG